MPPIDSSVEGIVEVPLDATHNYAKPLTQERLFDCRPHGINPFDYLKDLFTRLTVAKITAGWQVHASGMGKTKNDQSFKLSQFAAATKRVPPVQNELIIS